MKHREKMMGQYDKINKTLLSSQVEDAMLRYITEECAVGTKLPNEFALAERFGTSRTTIREVVKTLASQGVLRVKQGSGTYVECLVPSDNDPLHLLGHKDQYKLALELFDVRLMLEPEIAARAALERTEEEAKQIVKLCDEVEALYTSGKDHTQKDIELHSYIAKSSHNSVVESLVPLIQTAVVTFVNVTEGLLYEETVLTHRQIVEAITRKDSIGAKCAMTSHMAANRNMIIKLMEERKQKTKVV